MRYVERLSRLAFTAPSIVEAICRGRQPAELNVETLLNRIDLPLEWPTQFKAIGIDSNLARTVKRTGFPAPGDKPRKFAESGAGLALSGSPQAHKRRVTRGFSAHSRL